MECPAKKPRCHIDLWVCVRLAFWRRWKFGGAYTLFACYSNHFFYDFGCASGLVESSFGPISNKVFIHSVCLFMRPSHSMDRIDKYIIQLFISSVFYLFVLLYLTDWHWWHRCSTHAHILSPIFSFIVVVVVVSGAVLVFSLCWLWLLFFFCRLMFPVCCVVICSLKPEWNDYLYDV